MSELSKYDIEEREKYVSKAKSANSFLDAVFYIHYYNKDRKRWGPKPKPDDIKPQEVFADYDELEYSKALSACIGLTSKTAYVGAAFFKYENSGTYEDAVQRMKNEYPGFSEDIYGAVCNSSITAMR